MVSAVEKQLVKATFVSHRINGFMFFNLSTLSLESHLGVMIFASTPFVSGFHHPMGTPPVTAAQTHLLHTRRGFIRNRHGFQFQHSR